MHLIFLPMKPLYHICLLIYFLLHLRIYGAEHEIFLQILFWLDIQAIYSNSVSCFLNGLSLLFYWFEFHQSLAFNYEANWDPWFWVFLFLNSLYCLSENTSPFLDFYYNIHFSSCKINLFIIYWIIIFDFIW